MKEANAALGSLLRVDENSTDEDKEDEDLSCCQRCNASIKKKRKHLVVSLDSLMVTLLLLLLVLMDAIIFMVDLSRSITPREMEDYITICILACLSCECLLRMFGMGIVAFVKNYWNVFDFLVTALSVWARVYMDTYASIFVMVRVLRLLRVVLVFMSKKNRTKLAIAEQASKKMENIGKRISVHRRNMMAAKLTAEKVRRSENGTPSRRRSLTGFLRRRRSSITLDEVKVEKFEEMSATKSEESWGRLAPTLLSGLPDLEQAGISMNQVSANKNVARAGLAVIRSPVDDRKKKMIKLGKAVAGSLSLGDVARTAIEKELNVDGEALDSTLLAVEATASNPLVAATVEKLKAGVDGTALTAKAAKAVTRVLAARPDAGDPMEDGGLESLAKPSVAARVQAGIAGFDSNAMQAKLLGAGFDSSGMQAKLLEAVRTGGVKQGLMSLTTDAMSSAMSSSMPSPLPPSVDDAMLDPEKLKAALVGTLKQVAGPSDLVVGLAQASNGAMPTVMEGLLRKMETLLKANEERVRTSMSKVIEEQMVVNVSKQEDLARVQEENLRTQQEQMSSLQGTVSDLTDKNERMQKLLVKLLTHQDIVGKQQEQVLSVVLALAPRAISTAALGGDVPDNEDLLEFPV